MDTYALAGAPTHAVADILPPPVTGVAATAEVIEQDTNEEEDVSNIVQYVLPELSIQHSALNLGISINFKLFAGWVRQPSPCCGAASVAGAWNALFGLHRRSPYSFNHVKVIEAYCSLFTSKLFQQMSSFERKLGAPLTDVLASINTGLKRTGREFAGKKRCGPTRKTVLACVVQSVLDIQPSSCPPTECLSSNNSFECFRLLLEADGLYPPVLSPADQAIKAPEPEPIEDDKSEVGVLYSYLNLYTSQ
jgi:hypothetical protein